VNEPTTDPLVRIAGDELENTRRLIREHLKACTAEVETPGALAGSCDTCHSLAVHLGRCERQVELLAAGDDGAEVLF
jgi:hypothetical protein